MQELLINNITKTKYGYNLFINDFKINIEEMVFFKYRFKRGQTLTNNLLEQVKKENEVEFIKRKSIVYLSGLRSVLQFKTYLRSLNANEKLVEKLTNEYKTKGYLNDFDYAKSLVERLEFKYGKKRISQQLVQNGIHKDIIEQLLIDYRSPNLELIIESTVRKTKANNYIKAKEKIVRSLVSKGFNLDEINYYLPIYLKKEQFNEYKTIEKDYLKLLNKYKTKLEGTVLRSKLKSLLYQRGYSKEAIERVVRSN